MNNIYKKLEYFFYKTCCVRYDKFPRPLRFFWNLVTGKIARYFHLKVCDKCKGCGDYINGL